MIARESLLGVQTTQRKYVTLRVKQEVRNERKLKNV